MIKFFTVEMAQFSASQAEGRRFAFRRHVVELSEFATSFLGLDGTQYC